MNEPEMALLLLTYFLLYVVSYVIVFHCIILQQTLVPITITTKIRSINSNNEDHDFHNFK
jgi:hypothetical protein